MMNRPKLLFVNLAQYGYHTDSYQYCQYLDSHYQITYLCMDHGFKKVADHTHVIYLPKHARSIQNVLSLIHHARQAIQQHHYALVYIFYFKLCSLITLGLKPTFLLDIRTGAIDRGWLRRWQHNTMIRLEAKAFPHVTIISQSLQKKLKINPQKSTILPLGSNQLSQEKKSYDDFFLFYIGTLSGRNLHQTIEGLALFIEHHPEHNLHLRYDIFGDGFPKDLMALQYAIKKYGLEKIVHYHGRKMHHEIQPYFDGCNVGVAHIPMTSFYDPQPPTKLFEYLNAGMVTLATNTQENRRIINAKNGILYQDDAQGFKDALTTLYQRRAYYQYEQIIQSVQAYRWEPIVQTYLLPLLESLITQGTPHAQA